MSVPGEATFANPKPGDMLAGKYRVESILGKGGMGVVVAATHIQLGQRVAIKYLLQPDVEDIVARFLREARAAVRLKSEHVARVLDVGEFENGAPYMVMEYLEGDDLLRHLRNQGSLPVSEAVDYLLQTCEAIAEAHAAGIVHRDLKPANLFLTTTPDGSRHVKVLDFGISKINNAEDQGGDGMQLTKTEMVLGSPLYMSPEQLKSSREVDARSDIWALGVILYQLLAGKTPFSSATFSELILKVNLDAPTPLAEYQQGIPPELEAIIFKCLEKKRDNRYNNIGEFAHCLADFGGPTARISAGKARRVLEAAGIKVEAPQKPSAPPPAEIPQNPAGARSIPPGPADAAENPEGISTQSSMPTVALSKSAGGATAAGNKRSASLAAIAVAALGLALGAAFFLRSSPKESAEPGATPEKSPAAAATTAPQPEVKPINTSSPAVEPTVDLSPTASAAASAAAAPASSTRPAVAGASATSKTPAPVKTSTPAATTTTTTKTKSNNPLSGVGIE